MSRPVEFDLSPASMWQILEVTRRLAAPFDLDAMLATVSAIACEVLQAERCSVWLLDAEAAQVCLRVASDIADVRVPLGSGLVGACARDQQLINVPDCYADARFNPETDKRSGFHTRCSLTLPLHGHEHSLVGVMQVLNKAGGVFDGADEVLAQALAAQCAVALQRVRMLEAMLEGERMRQELEMARQVQMSTLPQTMPSLPGYDVFGCFQPADQTGGDTFDLAMLGERLLVVLADATGHGIAPALSVTQMHSMLRIALRLGAGLEIGHAQINDQLADTLADDRFITAFFGLLDLTEHRVEFISAGQGPILHYQAASGSCSRYLPTCFPLGAMHLPAPRASAQIELAPGDVLLLLSDGVYEQHDAEGGMFGEAAVEQLVHEYRHLGMDDMAELLLQRVRQFRGELAQEDDITIVLVRREGQA